MDKWRIFTTVGGAFALVGGGLQLLSIRKLRGRAPWRGTAVTGTAFTLYGALVLAGLVDNGTAVGSASVWAFAIALWFGLWLNRRDAARGLTRRAWDATL
jgi:hypothetical protein